MAPLTPGADRFQVKELLKTSRTSVVTHLKEIGSGRDLVGRCLLPPAPDSEVALLEGVAREAALLKRVLHATLPRFDRVVEGDGGTWMLWDYEPGIVLAQYLGSELALPETWVLWWLRTLLQALHTLHTQSPPWFVGHIEPSDVVVRDDRLMLVDLALFERIFPERAALSHHLFENLIAPEKRTSPQSSVATDLYAVGAVAFWLLTGGAPVVTGPGSSATVRAGLAVHRPSLEPGVADLVTQMLEFYPSQRPDRAETALRRLSPFLTGMTGQRPPAPSVESGHKFAADATRMIQQSPPALVVDESKAAARPLPPPPPRRPAWPWWAGALAAATVAGIASFRPLVPHARTPVLSLPAGQSTLVVGDATHTAQEWGHDCTVTFGPNSLISAPTWDGHRYDVSLFRGSMVATTGGSAGLDVHAVANNVIHIEPGSAMRFDLASGRVHCQRGTVQVTWPGHRRSLAAGGETTLVGGSTR